MPLSLTSPAFTNGGDIPERYTADGANVSPPLRWDGVPASARSLALVVEDPDAPDPSAPKMTFSHWVLYNLPPDLEGLPEGIPPEQLPKRAVHGRNDWGRTRYGGPKPPIGKHRYVHKLFALDIEMLGLGAMNKAELERAMEGHVLEQASLVGLYAARRRRRRAA